MQEHRQVRVRIGQVVGEQVGCLLSAVGQEEHNEVAGVEVRHQGKIVRLERSVLRKDCVNILEVDSCVENDILAVPDNSIGSIRIDLHHLVCGCEEMNEVVADKTS